MQEKGQITDRVTAKIAREIYQICEGEIYAIHTHGHATQRPSLNSRGGIASAQIGFAIGQRVRNAQPEGLRMGLGMSPTRRILRLSAASGSGSGTADRSAREYGCRGFW